MTKKTDHPLINLRVLIRAPGSGVFVGTLVGVSEHGASVQDIQRIWRWSGALDTCHLAAEGPTEAQISPIVPGLSVISDAREYYALSARAEHQIERIGVWSK